MRTFSCLAIWLLCLVGTRAFAQPALQLLPNDRICLVGNALGERMQHHNHWETLLYQSYPDHKLSVRNLCFPGDEPVLRLRSKNFGTPDEHLAHSQATVVLYFFGFNESFAGEQGRGEFGKQIRELIEHTRKQNYSGRGEPRIVLVSPIAFENTGDPNLPTGDQQNVQLKAYTETLASVAKVSGVGFVDLFSPSMQLFQSSDQRLTLNGAHLNDAGYRKLAPILMQGLVGETPVASSLDTKQIARLKTEIDDKNFHWWHRYRAVNGFSIYGDRGQAGSDGTYNNTDVMERERSILDQMTANRDERIWSLANGKEVSVTCDDSNTLAFIEPRTNVGIPDDPNIRNGKLGSLDYLSASEQQKMFKLAAGYEISLFASEEQFPELANPVALNFDNAGRLWVATMPSYPQWKPKTTLNDQLIILEDKNSDGKADDCKVFAGGLHQPTGFEFGNGGVYVAQQPDLLFLQDTDGDDREDTRIRRLVGLDSADSHHGISAFTWGPGGNLYFQEGTFKYSQVESPYGLTRLAEAGIWRYNPRTEEVAVHVSFSFANPWGHVFDRWGQDLIADASPGFSYWAAPISGHVSYPRKHPGGSQYKRVAELFDMDPSIDYPTFYPKRTRPSAGCELVSSRHFPPEDQGNFLLTNCIGDRAVLNHKVKDGDSGFDGEEVTPLVYCEDGNFRPVDIQFAPDGSLYIVDWHNALIGHLQHNLREPNRDHSHGRIWRVTYQGRPLVDAPNIAGQSIEMLLEALKEPEDRTRYRARREIGERPTEEVLAATENWLKHLDGNDPEAVHHELEALWVYQSHNTLNQNLLEKLLTCSDFRARAAATRVLSFWLTKAKRPMELLKVLVNDEHPRVRLEAVRALSFSTDEGAMEIALDVLNHEMDEYLQYTLDETMKTLEQ
ncbi:MAG: HEAT repeat domain-containing protein [Planctomycetales bacterium]|nr:HEAT repeat domain-containing protein [Planctomycetales bacterium]